MATPKNGLAAVFYAPCEVTARVGDGTTVRIVVDTDYPFDEVVQITVRTPKPVRFPLALRIPSWCESATVKVNGRQLKGEPKPNSFAIIERQWNDGDKVLLQLPMRLQVKVWEKQRNAISVRYGPLWFSLKIGERWEKYRQQGDWVAWEVSRPRLGITGSSLTYSTPKSPLKLTANLNRCHCNRSPLKTHPLS